MVWAGWFSTIRAEGTVLFALCELTRHDYHSPRRVRTLDPKWPSAIWLCYTCDSDYVPSYQQRLDLQ